MIFMLGRSIENLALTPPGGYAWFKNLKKSPVLQQKKTNRHPPKRWVFFMFWLFVFFCVFVFFSIDSSYFPLFLDILKPKMAHQKVL